MINKFSIIITSLGRTGTTFLADFFSNNFQDIYAVHEPGKIIIKKLNPKIILKAIKEIGIKGAVTNKLFGCQSIMQISNLRLAGIINAQVAANKIIKARKKYIETKTEKIYLESNYQYHGLLDSLPLAFQQLQAAYIVRDPRDWIRSWMNLKALYHQSDIHSFLGNRLTPLMAGDTQVAKEWKSFGQFEKLAWLWGYVNKFILKNAKNNPQIKIFRFEDLFLSSQKEENFYNFINFLISNSLGGQAMPKNIKMIIKNTLAKRVHKSKNSVIGSWRDWPKEKIKILDKFCSPAMQKFNYGMEKDYQELIKE